MKEVPINTAVSPTSKRLFIEVLAQSIGLEINLAILASTPAPISFTFSSPICFLPSKMNLANKGINTSATTKLISNAEIMVIGIALIKLPKIPPTKTRGAKLRAAVKVAAIIALLTLRVASSTAFLASFWRRRWASIASTIIMVSSTINDKLSIMANKVITFRVNPSRNSSAKVAPSTVIIETTVIRDALTAMTSEPTISTANNPSSNTFWSSPMLFSIDGAKLALIVAW